MFLFPKNINATLEIELVQRVIYVERKFFQVVEA